MNNRKRTALCLLGAALCVFMAFGAALALGRYPITPAALLAGDAMAVRTFTVLRLPRAVMALVGGFGLGTAGFVYQTVFRNPLASPDIIGVSSGASVGAAFAILFVSSGALSTTVCAFAGGLAAVFLSLGLAAAAPGRSKMSLVLAGIAVHALAQTLLMLLKLTADPEKELASIEYWIMGSLAAVTRSRVWFPVPVVLICCAAIFALHRQALLLSIEEGEARLLGVRVGAMRLLLLTLATMTVAAVVSVTGLISFVGLLAPHSARLLAGHNRRSACLLSGLLGSALLLAADTLAKTAASTELPVSIFTSLLGVPFLLYLILRPGRDASPAAREGCVMMPQTTPPPAGLCVQDLTVRYGAAAVLQGVSFSVPVPGQLIGLLGVNGSGKTTLLKAAAGLLPHTGQCLLDGVPLESLSTRRLAQTVSYIPQQSGISVSLSAREVVLMGFNPRLGVLQSPTAAMRAAADEALRTVGLADKAGQDYLTLSGGEKQLCILARTIAEDAPLLLLDEPDSALDLANRSRMTALLAQLVHTGGKTALVCLHDPALALDSCDILVVLQGGGVAAVLHPKTDPPAVLQAALAAVYGPLELLPVTDCRGRRRLALLPL